MSTKLMFAGCLHKRPKDITTIRGYTNCNRQVQLSLMEEIVKNKIDKFVSLGDWFDKGYGTDTAASLIDTDLDRQMSTMLNGEFYGVIGNHIRLRLDSNPELFLIQPHPTLKMRKDVRREEQIIKTPDYLLIDGVQISFMHYDNNAVTAVDYTPTRLPQAKKHIALFHTPYVIPAMKLYELNMQYDASSNSRISECLNDVDLAIVGDIHKPLGQFDINHSNGKVTTMIVPGSLTNTNAGMGSRHTSINIPIIEIHDGTYKLSYLFFDLKTNLLTFQNKTAEKEEDKLKSIRGNTVSNLYSDADEVSVTSKLHSDKVTMSLNMFMRQQGYTPSDMEIVKRVIHAPSDIKGIVGAYVGGLIDVQ